MLFTKKNLIQFRLPLYRIRKAPPRNGWRRRPARERGLNENTFMVLVIAKRRKAHRGGFLHNGSYPHENGPILQSTSARQSQTVISKNRQFPSPLLCLPVVACYFLGH